MYDKPDGGGIEIYTDFQFGIKNHDLFRRYEKVHFGCRLTLSLGCLMKNKIPFITFKYTSEEKKVNKILKLHSNLKIELKGNELKTYICIKGNKIVRSLN